MFSFGTGEGRDESNQLTQFVSKTWSNGVEQNLTEGKPGNMVEQSQRHENLQFILKECTQLK